jgi:hypothetical protein
VASNDVFCRMIAKVKTSYHMLKKEPKDSMPIQYCKDFYKWPDSWMGFDEDIETGENIHPRGRGPLLM